MIAVGSFPHLNVIKVSERFCPDLNIFLCTCFSTVVAAETVETAAVAVEVDLMTEGMTGLPVIGGQDHLHRQGMTVGERTDTNHQETEVHQEKKRERAREREGEVSE